MVHTILIVAFLTALEIYVGLGQRQSIPER